VNDLVLSGCKPEPLGSYLKALGVFRILSEQLDPNATARWDNDQFVLTFADADNATLLAFFIERYEPSPLVSPWNGGSGFDPKDQQAGISGIERSTGSRFANYRTTLAECRTLVDHADWAGLAKPDQVALCRSRLPDEAVRWIDAAVVLTTDGRFGSVDSREFPPLLGTGGNVGRLEFSNNFMQRLSDALAMDGTPRSQQEATDWLAAALGGHDETQLLKAAIGQMDPGGTGGANSDPTDSSGVSLVNPWDFVLAFEGAILFASSAARRMGSSARGKSAMPFMVNPTPIGYPSGSEAEGAKGELWAPLWRRSASLPEVERLLSEGRAEWGAKGRVRGSAQASSGLDFARAVASLGVDRGIDEFVRHSFLERHGQNMLAVPLGRFRVRAHATERILLTAGLDPWLESIRRVGNRPNGVDSLVRSLERSVFELASRDTAQNLQAVLIAAGRLDRAISQSRSMRAGNVAPLGLHGGQAWLTALGADSEGDELTELRLAIAFASQRDRSPNVGQDLPFGRTPGELIRPITSAWYGPARGRVLTWNQTARLADGGGPVVDRLGAFLDFRCRRPARPHTSRGTGESPPRETPPAQLGAAPSFDYAAYASPNDVERFVNGEIDDTVLADLIRGCALIDYDDVPARAVWGDGGHPGSVRIAPPLALLAPFFHGRPLTVDRAQLTVLINPGADWPRLLANGATAERVAQDGLRRLRVARLRPLIQSSDVIRASGIDSRRLLAALAFPLPPASVSQFLGRVACRVDSLEAPYPGQVNTNYTPNPANSMGDPNE